MHLRSIFVLTHDSIGLGEDGPTHQPIEHAASLRLIPGLDVWRPADNLETAVAWRVAIEREHGPSALLLSRQNLPQHGGGVERAASIAKGGYVLSDTDGNAGCRADRHRVGGRRSPPRRAICWPRRA